MAESKVVQEIRGNQNVQISQVQNATITVSIGSAPRRLLPLEPASLSLPQHVQDPSRLLRARYEVVPLVGAEALLKDLHNWAHNSGPAATRILAGTAGAGKTRIAIELCRDLAKLDWVTGLLKQPADAEALEMLATAPTARLIVIDYAEFRREQLGELLPILQSQASDRHPVRVLLTIRRRASRPEEVRQLLYGHGDALDLVVDTADIDLLAEQPFGEAQRMALFQAGTQALAKRLGRDADRPPSSPDLATSPFDTPLMVAAAAYLWVADGQVPTKQTKLLDGLLIHEDRYWARAAEATGLDIAKESGKTLRRRLVALATLAGADPSESPAAAENDASRLLGLVPDLGDASEERRRTLALWIHHLYPGPAWWNPVEPDLLGEHLVATTYGDQPQVLSGVLNDRGPSALVHSLRLLARAGPNHPTLTASLRAVLTDRIYGLCQLAIKQATSTEGTRLLLAGTTLASALHAVIANSPPDPERLGGVLFTFPVSNLLLDDLVLTLTTQLTDHLRQLAESDPATFLPELARALNDLSGRLVAYGRRQEALSAIAEAVGILRRLAESDPAAFLPDLALSLNSLSQRLTDLGRGPEAQSAVEEAVAHYRHLGELFRPELALTLNNLSVCLGGLGRRQEALIAIEEAVDIYWWEAANYPAVHLPHLADALNTLSIRLGDLGRLPEALIAIEEAVDHYRRLAEANPAAFLPDLAGSLNNLSLRLAELGRRPEALSAIEDAVGHYRWLTEANRAAFLPNLAISLGNLADRLAEAGRPEEAAQAQREAAAAQEECNQQGWAQ